MNLADFDYELPQSLIAYHPLASRTQSRLLCLNKDTGEMNHGIFSDLVSLIQPNDLLVCNNSKVIPARLKGNKKTGGQVELLIERILNAEDCLAHIRASKSPKPGSELIFPLEVRFKVVGREDDLFKIHSLNQEPILNLVEKIGEIPLPPYIERKIEASDQERYQTVYAMHQGSVAAPTAGLHFDDSLMTALKNKGVKIAFLTLHVGAGTFAPVKAASLDEHRMHKEYLEVSDALIKQIHETRKQGGKIIAVGTTSVRGLETAAQSGSLKPYSGETDIFIKPGYMFKCVDGLITNFHFPRSTLLMLVSAFGGYQHIKEAYQEAIRLKYRFFSYGDAMYIHP